VILKKASTEEVIRYLNISDFAINPVMPVPSKRYCTSIKDGEYWACGLPVLITKNISDDSDIIQNNKIGSVIQQLNEKSYTESILELDALLKENPNGQLNQKVKAVCKNYRSFSIAETIYKEIYSNA
jgi:glycosyltransferase involved in cell wall biosynthesis